ncbi:MAG: divergent polysaccharide deacetylase family protein [Candidatus Acidiferrales bacterium]
MPTLSDAQLRAITGEVIAAAQKVAGRASEVTIRPQMAHSGDGLAAEVPVDNIYLSLTNPSQQIALAHSLTEIARRHNLSIVETSSGDVERFSLSFRGNHTHVVHVITPLAARAPAPVPRGSSSPRLAIILDDFGNDRSAADAALTLPFPLTISVLPHLTFSAEIAESAYRRGDQVLLHLPMEPQSAGASSERSELRVGMNARQVQSEFAAMLATVPHAAGVNNHEGSRATADPLLMQELMPTLRARGLFFVDSRTTPATVAYDAAKRSGVPAASRKVFLDDTPAPDAILAQLDLAARDAFRDGSAIAIGHPHPATIAALAGTVPALEARGVRLVFASDLVH